MPENATKRAAPNHRETLIGNALDRAATIVSQPENAHWLLRVRRLRRTVSVRFASEWVEVSVPLNVLRKPMNFDHVSAMLRNNRRVRGCPRFVGDRLGRRRRLLAEIPADTMLWDSQDGIDAMISAMLKAVVDAMDGTSPAPAMSTTLPYPEGDIEARLEQAGWPPLETDDAALAVPLDVSGEYIVANLRHDGRSTRLQVPILESQLPSAPDDCRRAVAVLIWLIASRMRLVKPMRHGRYLTIDAAPPPGDVTPAALGHCCAALSTALESIIAEARLLVEDKRLARAYLKKLFNPAANASRGPSRRRERRTHYHFGGVQQ